MNPEAINIATLNVADLARFLFDRPISTDPEFGSSDEEPYPDTAIIQLAVELFDQFPTLVAPYSPDQVGQGMRYLIGPPCWVINKVTFLSDKSLAIACIRSSFEVFRWVADAYPSGTDDGGVHYMWWDEGWESTNREIVQAALETLADILDLDGWTCQAAALHGLNHLNFHRGASTLVQRYIDRVGPTLTPEQRRYAIASRDGRTA